MAHLKLNYFDLAVRGETARMAMFIGNINFEDNRIPYRDWPTEKVRMPFLTVPTLEIDGKMLSQCNAINRYVGKLANLYPEDAYQAALCDEILDAIEDIGAQIGTTFGMKDEAEKQNAREALATGPIKQYLQQFATYLKLQGGDYFADGRLTIADLGMTVFIKNFSSGFLDYIPADIVEKNAPLLLKHLERVENLEQIIAYNAPRA